MGSADGAVLLLFLDELILWLASHASSPDFVTREGQKLTKLVEAQHAGRPVPIVSFIARQRSLRELVGENFTGIQQLNFDQALAYWEARFGKITLEDRNLPAIIEKRVLCPRSEAARQEMNRAFTQTEQEVGALRDILMTSTGDSAMFRRVYPFSRGRLCPVRRRSWTLRHVTGSAGPSFVAPARRAPCGGLLDLSFRAGLRRRGSPMERIPGILPSMWQRARSYSGSFDPCWSRKGWGRGIRPIWGRTRSPGAPRTASS